MISKIFSTKIGASPIDGSSSMSSFGSRHQRPPDRAHLLLAAGQRARLLVLALGEPREEREDAVETLLMPERSLRWKAPISRFSITLMRGKRRRPSGDWLMPILTTLCGGSSVMSVPWKWIVPSRGWLRPLIERSVVDLPAPFAPISVTISPSCTSIEIPFSASIEP